MPFADLKEVLLKGGIAPRHVHRYIAELNEHLEDLADQERKAGHDAGNALIRARARLGGSDELAAAMLEQKQFRSLAARAPWAIFALFPPLAALAISMLSFRGLLLIGNHYGFLANQAPVPPQWFLMLTTGMMAITNLLVIPLTATAFVAVAIRQRLKLVWPVATTLLLLCLFVHSDSNFAPQGDRGLVIGFDPVFMTSAQEVMLEHWPLVTAQYLLTLLPLLWFCWNRRRLAT